MNFVKPLFIFGYHQAMSCLFPVFIFIIFALTKVISISFLPRYDLILILLILAQITMYVTKLETADELKVICIFHFIGLALEIFKVHMGSWSYPDEGITKVFGVPLYSGFMYASVASYMCQAWRRFDLQLVGWPSNWKVSLLAGIIYFNFFTHHFIMDLRWILKSFVAIIFFRTVILFRIDRKVFRMPLAASFVLIGFFIWIAENIATFLGAWQYPNQHEQWHLVHVSKISSWLLLVIVSFLIVAQLKHIKKNRPHHLQKPLQV